MFTDMVGYTALGQRNESLSLALVDEQRKLIRPVLSRHNGREIKTIGDAFLVEFPNALDAVRCAYDIQRAVREFNISLSEERRVHLRVGIHLGDVVESRNDIAGDAVNIASRIESLADDGGVCLTRQVYDHVQNKFELPLRSLGPTQLKNVSTTVEVYKMVMPWEEGRVVRPTLLDKRRIAVLPIANMSPDPNDQFFADGMTEELIDRLSQVKQLRVIARTSIMNYKNEKKNAAQIGRELGVGTLVEGSVRKAGNRVRVTVQLIASESEEHLWSSRYDRSLDDIFEVQGDIASKVADELKVQLIDSEKQLLEKRPTEDAEAYTHFLRGRELLREGSEPSLRRAIEFLEKAVELDSSFARAYSALANCYLRLGNDGYDPWEESIARAKVPLNKALELDPDLAEAHVVLSLIMFNEDNLARAVAEAKRATELNPSLPDAYEMLAMAAWSRGETDEGTRLAETYYRLDPIRPAYVRALGMVYFYLGREAEALQHWEKTRQLAPAGTYRLMAEHALWKGNYERAKELHTMAENLQPTHPWVTWMRGFMAAQMGDRETAFRIIRQIEESKKGIDGLNGIGYIYYALGDFDSYFDYMNRALESHVINIGYSMYCPLFAKGRADPRYQKLIEKMRKMQWPDGK